MRALERGDAATVEFQAFAPVLVALVGLIAFTALARSAQIPLWAAARECAREASAYLDVGRSRAQGAAAAWGSLRGNNLDAVSATVHITAHGGPGSDVICTVTYRADLRGLPMSAWFNNGMLDLRAASVMRVERHKSR
jgi:Flp pilus assembly protein TadG